MIIGLGNGLSPVQYQAITQTKTALFQVAPSAQWKKLLQIE